MKRVVLVEQEQDVCDLHHGEDVVSPVTKATITVGDERVEWDVCDSHARTIRSWMMLKKAETTPVTAPVKAVVVKAVAAAPTKTTRTRAAAKKAVAKKTTAKKTTASRRATANGYQPRVVRAWAVDNGVEIPKNGPIPKSVVDLYKAAMAAV